MTDIFRDPSKEIGNKTDQNNGHLKLAFKPKPRPKWTGWSVEEIEAFQPVPWLVEDHLEPHSLGVIFGDSGTCKTFYALDMAMCMATGQRFLGKYAVDIGPVIYISSEGGKFSIRKRIKAWLKAHDLVSIPSNMFRVILYSFDLCDGEDQNRIMTVIGDELGDQPCQIFIDTFARNFRGDANSEKEMGNFVRAADHFRETYDCGVAIIHHTGHSDKERMRSSSALPCALDWSIRISRARGKRLVASNPKQKDNEEFHDYYLKPRRIDLPEIKNAFGREFSSFVLDFEEYTNVEKAQEAANEQDYWLGLIPRCRKSDAKDKGVTIKQLIEMTPDVSKSTWYNRIKVLQDLEPGRKVLEHSEEGASANVPKRYYRDVLETKCGLN